MATVNNTHDNRKIEMDLFKVIPGEKAHEYLVHACWNYEGDDPEEIVSGVFAVHAVAGKIEWKLLFSIDTWVTSIYRFTPNCYILGTASGELIDVKNSKRVVHKTGQFGGVVSIWGVDEQNCWFAHSKGLSHWDGAKISRNFPTQWVNLIQPVQPNIAIAVGAKGIVLRFDGSDWHEVDSVPTNKQLIGLHRVSDKEIYVCGWDGVLYRWNGQDYWEKIDVIHNGESVKHVIYCVIEYLGVIYVGLGRFGLFKVEGKKATQIKDFFCSRMAVIDGKLILTGSNSLVEFDGANWRNATITLL
ncbi:hypothetical protein F2P44_01845 [Massilia sp. CCM 8695]|uniref:WD40 repeat domain-containing protein n=1 Tax=Massilia frigida TaxID=2609281 RepID=A0ABX0MZ19_9BURK|nr:hypothetical protein [Massilia frigida]NHZ78042.1 hypothetical protein [Massilia frigida]